MPCPNSFKFKASRPLLPLRSLKSPDRVLLTSHCLSSISRHTVCPHLFSWLSISPLVLYWPPPLPAWSSSAPAPANTPHYPSQPLHPQPTSCVQLNQPAWTTDAILAEASTDSPRHKVSWGHGNEIAGYRKDGGDRPRETGKRLPGNQTDTGWVEKRSWSRTHRPSWCQ